MVCPCCPRWRAPGRSCLEPHAYTCQLSVNSKRSRAAGAPRPAGRETGDPSQSACLPLPHERAIQSRPFLWQRGDSKPCECPSCPCLAQQAYSQGPACSPTHGAFCGLQGQPCQVTPRGTNPSCQLTWKVLTLFSRGKLGVRGGDTPAQGLSRSRDPLPRHGNSKPNVSTGRQLLGMGAVSDGMTPPRPSQGCYGKGGGGLPLACQIGAERRMGI